ncbi:MAC/perforin domain-containing protein [Paraburkholderia sp. BL10I2N1]|uniref:MAC/perforin domain-containing protein n=1 Tax=Paraburkholderia sp. BL10I2N1 TaxID=1938796 RepID=UPI00105ECF7C|nr:MAC/perforin domain-containing protein [Paraburkholderia sp. BL10I2N1]TDN58901.1 MAC/Perforin domain-containing protein [Paraburkholderia sp. BL10I2N1]
MISYTLQARDSKSRPDAAPDDATLADLRKVFISTGEMDTEDQFRSGTSAETLKVVPDADESNTRITDSMVVAIVPIRRTLTFVDKAGKKHPVFVRPDETLGQFRKNNAKLIADADVFVIGGEPVATADEDGTYLRRLDELAVERESRPAPAAVPKIYKLLLLKDGGKPKAIDWPGGGEDKTLKDLRAFLKEDAPADLPFLDSAQKAVPLDMEPFETVGGKLGKADDKLGLLRFRFETPRKRNAATTPGASSSGSSTTTTAAAPAGSGATPSLRDTQDLLAPFLGRPTIPVGAPQDVFDRMDVSEQAALLAALRHLHGLRFVLAADGSYELERALRPAFDAESKEDFVAVVRPITSTRFSASATQVRTLDAISSSLSWNVGGSVGVEGKAASLSIKSDYKDETTRSRETASSELHLRVEYLVARGEVVIDPRSIVLSKPFFDDATALAALAKGKAGADCVGALARILDSYGTHVPLRTIFGGKLIYRQDRKLEANTDKNERVREFSADVQGSYKAVTASARSGFKTKESATKIYESSDQAIEVTASGGNPALALDPYGWAATLSHAGWWNAIAFADVVPLLSLLPPDLKETIIPILLNSNELGAALSTPIDWATYRAQMLKEFVRTQRGGEEISFAASPAPGADAPRTLPPVQPVAPQPVVTPQPAPVQAGEPQSQPQTVKPGGEEVDI